jgi:membrane protease YdiL (CAAX protease family)
VVSAALFAAIHLEPVRFPLLLTIGLELSWLRARTGRVGASIVAHSFNNLYDVLLLVGIA